jgi:hypothetical protein
MGHCFIGVEHLRDQLVQEPLASRGVLLEVPSGELVGKASLELLNKVLARALLKHDCDTHSWNCGRRKLCSWSVLSLYSIGGKRNVIGKKLRPDHSKALRRGK